MEVGVGFSTNQPVITNMINNQIISMSINKHQDCRTVVIAFTKNTFVTQFKPSICNSISSANSLQGANCNSDLSYIGPEQIKNINLKTYCKTKSIFESPNFCNSQ